MSAQTSPSGQSPAVTPSAPVKPRPTSSGPEALDSVIKTTKARGWWALWAITVAVVAALIWSFVATIPTQATAIGVIPTSIYSTAVTSPAEGKFTLNLGFGGNITKGQELGSVQPFDGSAAVTVTSPSDGVINGIFVDQGDSVQLGTKIGEIVAPPNPAEGVTVVTYLPASSAMKFTEGQEAQVTVTNVATSESAVVDAVITSVATVPASIADMEIISGSSAVAQQWFDESDGAPYRVFLNVERWSNDEKTLVPASGQIVQITNTYGSEHPIALLFGGK